MQRRSILLPTRYLLGIAAAACLALFAIAATAQDDDPPAQAGRLAIVNGNVSIQPAGAQDWGQAYLNYPLGPGDRIFTDADGRAEIEVGRTYVRVGPRANRCTCKLRAAPVQLPAPPTSVLRSSRTSKPPFSALTTAT